MNFRIILPLSLVAILCNAAMAAEPVQQDAGASCRARTADISRGCEADVRAETRDATLKQLSPQCRTRAALFFDAATTKPNMDAIKEARMLCDNEFDRAGMWRLALTIQESAMKCLLQRLPDECKYEVHKSMLITFTCQEKLTKLCGKESSGYAMQRCMRQHQQELTTVCRVPPPQIEQKRISSARAEEADAKILEHWRAFQAMDNSTPEMRVIGKWHAAVMRGDQAAVNALRPPLPAEHSHMFSPGLLAGMFQEQIKTTPSKLWVGPIKKSSAPGAQLAELAGCAFVPAYGKDVRVQSTAQIVEKDGQMYAFVSQFVPVMGELKNKCPM